MRLVSGGVRTLPMLLAIAFLAPVARADAASVRTAGGCDRYGACDYAVIVSAAPGEVNAVAVTFGEKGELVVRDSGARLRAGRLCAPRGDGAVECESASGVLVRAGDRDDTVDASGAAGAEVVVHGGPGDDRLTAPAQEAVLAGDAGLDTLAGGSAVDYSSENAAVRIDLASQTAVTAAGTERFAGIEGARGGHGGDRLIGGEGPDQLDGGPGADLVSGRGGDDQLLGGPGRDVLRGGPGDDVVGNLGYEAPRDRGRDRLDCGPGTDTGEPVEAGFVVDASCERLFTEELGRVTLHDDGARPYLAIPRRVAGPPVQVRATARLEGSGRIERRLRFGIGKSRKGRLRGSRALWLTSKPIRAARRRGDVVLDVRVQAVVPGVVGPGEAEPDARYRVRLRVRLPRRP